MKHDISEYMTTAEAANELGLSVGSIQKLVTTGELVAVRTQGGHRRIYNTSICEYKSSHGYCIPKLSANLICIIHQGDILDPMLKYALDSKKVRLLTHPLDLLGVDEAIDVLFIDACNVWLETTPPTLIIGLLNRCPIFIYNSEKLPDNSHFHEENMVQLIPKDISYQFISGYIVGREILKRRQ